MNDYGPLEIPEPKIARLFFADTRLGLLWLVVRLYVGWEWLSAALSKMANPAWTGAQAGAALQGFISGAVAKASGAHPDVALWYANFLTAIVSHHPVLFSYVVTYGELAVGTALMLGLLTGIASFFGAFMNFNYLFAGTVSINPILLLLELFLMFAWRNAGWFGADRWLLPLLGVPWQKGKLFSNKPPLRDSLPLGN